MPRDFFRVFVYTGCELVIDDTLLFITECFHFDHQYRSAFSSMHDTDGVLRRS